MDPRHSRYVEKVIGTTWTLGANEDLARPPFPLRLDDRRSEGESQLRAGLRFGQEMHRARENPMQPCKAFVWVR